MPLAAQSGDNIIRIALIDDFSGAYKKQGDQVLTLFEDYAKTTNSKGGIVSGSKSYKIAIIGYDTGGSPMKAHESMNRAAQRDDAIVAVCSHFICAQAAESTKTPLILTASSVNLSKEQPTTFLIRAPTPNHFSESLVIKTLDEALKRTSEPTPAKITEALRGLKFDGELGAVSFDKSGNNVGLVPFPFRPDGAGCTNSCASKCPSNCGKTACSKSNGNECCSICGMPRPN